MNRHVLHRGGSLCLKTDWAGNWLGTNWKRDHSPCSVAKYKRASRRMWKLSSRFGGFLKVLPVDWKSQPDVGIQSAAGWSLQWHTTTCRGHQKSYATSFIMSANYKEVKVLWQNFHFLSYIQLMGFFLMCYFSLCVFSYNFCVMPTCHLYALLKFVLIYLIYVFMFSWLFLGKYILIVASWDALSLRESKSSWTST